jgi:hypothetical protein
VIWRSSLLMVSLEAKRRRRGYDVSCGLFEMGRMSLIDMVIYVISSMRNNKVYSLYHIVLIRIYHSTQELSCPAINPVISHKAPNNDNSQYCDNKYQYQSKLMKPCFTNTSSPTFTQEYHSSEHVD